MNVGDILFSDRYSELHNPKYRQAEVLINVFSQIVWRIKELEREVEQL
jgi:hypothetical protein